MAGFDYVMSWLRRSAAWAVDDIDFVVVRSRALTYHNPFAEFYKNIKQILRLIVYRRRTNVSRNLRNRRDICRKVRRRHFKTARRSILFLF